jgi:hypothetical protein
VLDFKFLMILCLMNAFLAIKRQANINVDTLRKLVIKIVANGAFLPY